MSILTFPNRFLNESMRHEFELKNSLNPRPKKDNREIRMLKMIIWARNFDRKMQRQMQILR